MTQSLRYLVIRLQYTHSAGGRSCAPPPRYFPRRGPAARPVAGRVLALTGAAGTAPRGPRPRPAGRALLLAVGMLERPPSRGHPLAETRPEPATRRAGGGSSTAWSLPGRHCPWPPRRYTFRKAGPRRP